MASGEGLVSWLQAKARHPSPVPRIATRAEILNIPPNDIWVTLIAQLPVYYVPGSNVI